MVSFIDYYAFMSHAYKTRSAYDWTGGGTIVTVLHRSRSKSKRDRIRCFIIIGVRVEKKTKYRKIDRLYHGWENEAVVEVPSKIWLQSKLLIPTKLSELISLSS